MIERIHACFSSDSVSRYRVLYGPGIGDRFLDEGRGDFLDLETALVRGLQDAGYQRIVFISADEPIYFRDKQSMELTLKVSQRTESLLQPKPSKFAGPIGNYNVLGNSGISDSGDTVVLSDTNELRPYQQMGDSFALRKIHQLMMSEENIPTAVVIMQAETFIRHQPDQRSVSAKLGKWELKSVPHQAALENICLFVFADATYAQLTQTAMQLSIPELRSFILSEQHQQDVIYLGFPRQDELERLIEQWKMQGVGISNKKKRKLIRAILAEGGKLSLWSKRIVNQFTQTGKFTIERTWFSQYLPGEKNAFERLRELQGLEPVTKHLRETAALIQTLQEEEHFVLPTLHMMFVGNPGTGKTTVARLVGEIYFDLGVLKRGHLVEARYDDLVGQSTGATPRKTNLMVDQALDGVLFIDEAYMLSDASRGGFGREAIDTLLTRMENDRDRFVVIFAGYPDRMERFRASNPGLPRRIPEENMIHFPDFTAETLYAILLSFFQQNQFDLMEDTEEILKAIIHEMYQQRDEAFGNAGEMRNVFEAILRNWALRHISDKNPPTKWIEVEDIPETYRSYVDHQPISARTLTDTFKDLVGMDGIREAFQDLSDQIEYQRLVQKMQPGESQPLIRPQHMAFLGNPGTGKTTIARKIGEFYAKAGILRKGHCIEVTRADLVGQYVGHTAPKTMAQVRKALDGVLFIDEAYSLNSGNQNDFGNEAIEMLVKVMEDYRDRLVIIFAGYPNEMHRFMQMNSGLASRIPQVFHFPDFTQEELGEILVGYAEREGYILPSQVREIAEKYLLWKKEQDETRFGNARTVRNLFQRMRTRLSQRVLKVDREMIAENPDLLYSFEVTDLPIKVESRLV